MESDLLFTDAAVLLLGSQITYILRFFLAKNIHIARDRAWEQTVASRGKGPDFWFVTTISFPDGRKHDVPGFHTSKYGFFVLQAISDTHLRNGMSLPAS
jgi:hypothetical protein